MLPANWLKITLFCLASLFCVASMASDLGKEKRWADQVVDSLMVGEAQSLAVGQNKILALYTEQTTAKPLGGTIVLHGSGVHPNWDQVIRPLRSELPEYGWTTLSVQMPILANDARLAEYEPLFDEVAPRLDAAVKFLRAKGINNIVIVAHSLGAAMAAHYVAKTAKQKDIRALVSIGSTGVSFEGSNKNFFKSLETIKIPVLDMYGSNDLPEVLHDVDKKAQLAKKYGVPYTQVKMEGADHFFTGKQDELVKRVRGWLKTHATENK